MSQGIALDWDAAKIIQETAGAASLIDPGLANVFAQNALVDFYLDGPVLSPFVRAADFVFSANSQLQGKSIAWNAHSTLTIGGNVFVSSLPLRVSQSGAPSPAERIIGVMLSDATSGFEIGFIPFDLPILIARDGDSLAFIALYSIADSSFALLQLS